MLGVGRGLSGCDGEGRLRERVGFSLVDGGESDHGFFGEVAPFGDLPFVAGIEDPDDEPAYLPDLVTAGWELRVREPGHRCLRAEPAIQRFDGGPTLPANLHCYRPSSPEVSRYLNLRDRLRADPAARSRYADLKRSLATRGWADMNLYADAKGPLIRELLAEPPDGSAQSPPYARDGAGR